MAKKKKELPDFIPPMLAETGTPFDSDDYLFEIKWDGVRVLAFIEESGLRLVNRRKYVVTERYPDLRFLERIPPGTVLDGEIVVIREGKSQFPLVLSREQGRDSLRINALAKQMPATYVAFDFLYVDYESTMDLPLEKRREILAYLVQEINHPQFLLSDGVVSHGKAFFDEACKRELEGVMAKRLNSRYTPGRRSDAWQKIKRLNEVICAIVGFTLSEERPGEFRSLVIAAEENGKLRCVGKVGSGISETLRKKLNKLLVERLQDKPLCDCGDIKGNWVAPGLFCRVTFTEQMESGDLRFPAFKELIIPE